ncbi:MAG: SPASM domain-containing protein [Calditrichota bacterium]
MFAEDFRGLTTSYSIGEIRHFIEQAYTIADRFPQLQITGLDGFDDRFSKYCRLPVIRPEVALKRKTPSCRAPWDSLFINPYGYAYPCPNTSYFFGNLVQRPLEEVWNSHAAQVFRKRLAAYDHRDCFPGCAENARPVNLLYHDIRKAVWIARRDPKHFLQKGLRRLGLTNAHLKTKISA